MAFFKSTTCFEAFIIGGMLLSLLGLLGLLGRAPLLHSRAWMRRWRHPFALFSDILLGLLGRAGLSHSCAWFYRLCCTPAKVVLSLSLRFVEYVLLLTCSSQLAWLLHVCAMAWQWRCPFGLFSDVCSAGVTGVAGFAGVALQGSVISLVRMDPSAVLRASRSCTATATVVL